MSKGLVELNIRELIRNTKTLNQDKNDIIVRQLAQPQRVTNDSELNVFLYKIIKLYSQQLYQCIDSTDYSSNDDIVVMRKLVKIVGIEKAIVLTTIAHTYLMNKTKNSIWTPLTYQQISNISGIFDNNRVRYICRELEHKKLLMNKNNYWLINIYKIKKLEK